MKTRAVILAGGEGCRLSVLTAKRTKPAVPFAGKYRIIDFTLSNCVNSGIFDVMILLQYRPHSLIEHIGAGGPWDLDRDFTGGVRLFTPFRGRRSADWYLGTADAVQQNFSFIKHGHPDTVLILSGDHVYCMDYDILITFHRDHDADLTMATIRVPWEEASRFGIVEVDEDYRVTSFVEKPAKPPSNLANMGVYVFRLDVLDRVLWEDHKNPNSSHDFGKDILPKMVREGARVLGFPYSGYWVDVGTTYTYWKAHMDLLGERPSIDLNDRSWVIHTRTEERPPARIARGALIQDSLISDGCVIAPGAVIERSVLSPGVRVHENAILRESIVFTDTVIESGALVERSILDKRVRVGKNAHIGSMQPDLTQFAMVGKNSVVPENYIIEAGALIYPDVEAIDYPSHHVPSDAIIENKREPFEI
ncbi:MAG: sugar phosphate nucleotidyltransferase [Anaerolineales bacterium]|nr:sugar phosphate nucleotidyltransferase [Anaerolineales bacterium]MCS7247313.1 sugar phosphate nucleotidyltransferase [Anaerolineales bacterium]MDW8161124.1 sugar phosphate nucleotidyltransferase [Anaerolineales bacterium]MDW8446127.1 sugar phosphate nucleotidyltransferase [Anaerolineales bacterium]